MDPNAAQNGAAQGPNGRRLHIAHRRSPSEMTPLMMEQLALAQQIEMLQQQQQQIAATHQQYVNMGMIPQQQQLPTQFQQLQGQMQNSNVSPQTNQFQFQNQMAQQQMGIPMTGGVAAPGQQAHRRNQSAMPNMSMGPPPAPSAGASGFNDPNAQQSRNENAAPRGGRGGAAAGQGGGHARRHSLALPEAKKAAELAEAKRKTSGFQFPIPGAGGATPTTGNLSTSPGQAPAEPLQSPGSATRGGIAGRGHGRSQSMAVGNGRGMAASNRGGPAGFQFPPPQATVDGGANNTGLNRSGSQGHGRTQSRNFDGNWRQPQQQSTQINDPAAQNMGNFQLNQATAQSFQPGHRNRGSMSTQSVNSIAAFPQFPQAQLMPLTQGQVLMQQPVMYGGQQLNALQLAQLQAYQSAGLQPPALAQLTGQHNAPMGIPQQQQQRKTLFTPTPNAVRCSLLMRAVNVVKMND